LTKKKRLGYILGDFLTISSGHPGVFKKGRTVVLLTNQKVLFGPTSGVNVMNLGRFRQKFWQNNILDKKN
jgi:hypothetical protein